jgi:hypothetical protein
MNPMKGTEEKVLPTLVMLPLAAVVVGAAVIGLLVLLGG